MATQGPISQRGSRRRDVLRLCGEIMRARPIPFAALVATTLVGSARTGLYVLAMGGITQAMVERDQDAGLLWAGLFAFAMASEELYWSLKWYLASIVSDHAIFDIQRRVLERASSAPLVAFEHGPFFASLQRANDNLGNRFMMLLMALLDTAQVSIMAGSVLAAVWFASPFFAGLILVAAIPALLLQRRVATRVHDALQRHAMTDRLRNRLAGILIARPYAAEVRLFGNGQDLLDRWRTARSSRATDVLRAERSVAGAHAWSQTAFFAAITISLGMTLAWLHDGTANAGTWVIVLQGTQWSVGIMGLLPMAFAALREHFAYLGDFFEFEDNADVMIFAAAQGQPAEMPATIPTDSVASGSGGMEIVASDVSFRYPGATVDVVSSVDLRLAPGERVALVGENGAGKSTLVRLLTGLYHPSTGRVTLDGLLTTDPASDSLRPEIGAVFQEIVEYQLTVRDAIAFGDLSRPSRNDDLLQAADAAGAGALVRGLPDGLDTWLGREFGERDLSGGEWQRLALARAFYRDARFLVLDEPTAAMDPLAEQALFARFADLVAGKTALMVSHRLGPARFADRILVMSHGRIVESGTHHDLIARNGAYAAMWSAQSDWYT